jgi:hypothetical protein
MPNPQTWQGASGKQLVLSNAWLMIKDSKRLVIQFKSSGLIRKKNQNPA